MNSKLILVLVVTIVACMASANKVGSSLGVAKSTASSLSKVLDSREVDIVSAVAPAKAKGMISPNMKDGLKVVALFTTWYAANAACKYPQRFL